LLKKKRDLKKIVIKQLWYTKSYFTVDAHIYSKWNTDCRNAHRVHLAWWVDCYRCNNSSLSMQASRCMYRTQESREWSSNKRSQLLFTEFNVRV